MSKIEKEQFKPVTTIEITDAIENLIEAKIALNEGKLCRQEWLDSVEINRRIIVDGLRFHSAAKGIVSGKQ